MAVENSRDNMVRMREERAQDIFDIYEDEMEYIECDDLDGYYTELADEVEAYVKEIEKEDNDWD